MQSVQPRQCDNIALVWRFPPAGERTILVKGSVTAILVIIARQRIAFPDARLEVSGLPWFNEDKPALRRLPSRLKDRFRPPVWDLAQDPSGGRIRFRTDSTRIGLIAQNPCLSNMHHMASVGENGFDLYVGHDYQGSAWPDAAGGTKVFTTTARPGSGNCHDGR